MVTLRSVFIHMAVSAGLVLPPLSVAADIGSGLNPSDLVPRRLSLEWFEGDNGAPGSPPGAGVGGGIVLTDPPPSFDPETDVTFAPPTDNGSGTFFGTSFDVNTVDTQVHRARTAAKRGYTLRLGGCTASETVRFLKDLRVGINYNLRDACR